MIKGAGNIFTATYSIPFYKTIDGKRTFQGIVTADISLDWLVKIISPVSTFKSGYSFLISKNGNFVSNPDDSLILKETIFSIADARKDPQLREIGETMIHGKKGFVPYQSFYLNRPSWMYYSPLPTTAWSMGVVAPEDELFADIHQLNRHVFLIAIAGFTILMLVIFTISNRMIRPLETLASTTTEIARENDSFMFVTVFCGILDIQTGEFIYTNAGHNPPVLIRKNQAPEWLKLPEGFILGPLMNTAYKNDRMVLNPGDLLLLYTDGVNEAMNEDRIIYSDERLIGTVADRKSDSAEQLVSLVMESVKRYSGEQPQSDDITILALRYDGNRPVPEPI